MRALSQGTARQRDRVAHRRAVADLRARRRRRAPRPQDLTRRRVVGVILAGGASRRFGGAPKGLATVRGARVVDRVRRAVASVADTVVLSANDPDGHLWVPDLPVVRDVHPGTGGLSGVHAALERDREADALVVAWDMPFVTAPLLLLLKERFTASGAEVCVPESGSPHGIEPFCACYAAGVRERLAAFLRAGGGAAHDFLRQCTVVRIAAAELASVGDPATLFLSINEPRDLDRARALGG